MRTTSSSSLLTFSDRVYRWMLKAYPRPFQDDFGADMAQVFRDLCRDAYLARGALAISAIWMHTLVDYTKSLIREHLQKGKYPMDTTASFTQQIPELLDLFETTLRSGYSVLQSFEIIAKDLPEPVSSEMKQVVAAIKAGAPALEALRELQARVQSDALDLVVATLVVHRQVGGNLADMLNHINHLINTPIHTPEGPLSLAEKFDLLAQFRKAWDGE